jgi:hypothetical protein
MAASGMGGISPLAAAARSLVEGLDSLTRTQSENLINPMHLSINLSFKIGDAHQHFLLKAFYVAEYFNHRLGAFFQLLLENLCPHRYFGHHADYYRYIHQLR